MRNEQDLSVDISKARLAQDFINNPLFIEGLTVLKASTLDKFESLNSNQVKEMVDCNKMLKVIDEFETRFYQIISTGNAALSALDDIKQHEKEMNNER